MGNFKHEMNKNLYKNRHKHPCLNHVQDLSCVETPLNLVLLWQRPLMTKLITIFEISSIANLAAVK